MEHRRKCECEHEICCEVIDARKERLKKRGTAAATTAETDKKESIFLSIQYYRVVTETMETLSNVSLSRLKSNHNLLNHCLNLTNADDLLKTPRFYEQHVGDCQITVSPSDANDLLEENIITIYADKTFNDLSDVSSYARSAGYPPIFGVMNVYICILNNNLLGQSQLEGYQLTITSGCVGSADNKGHADYSPFNEGKTLVHELGHSFGLLHPFTYGNCVDIVLPDIPLQKAPNTNASLVFDAGLGYWVTSNEHREIDCSNIDSHTGCGMYEPDFSCSQLPFQSEAINLFMSYSADEYMINFSKDQAELARSSLLNNPLIDTFASNGTLIGTNMVPANSDDLALGLIIMFSFLMILLVVATVLTASKRRRLKQVR